MIDLALPTAWIVNYTLLLCRTAGVVAFAPLPGLRQTPALGRVVLAAILAFALAPAAEAGPAPAAAGAGLDAWTLAGWVLAETSWGLAAGVALRLLLDAFGLAAQILGFQAGYSYVNMVDPTSQVDTAILNVMLSLLSSLLFFAFDLHLMVVRALARSLETWPLGSFAIQPGFAEAIIHLGASMFETAALLALPVIAVLLLTDLTLGLLNQVQSRLQLLTLSFTLKIVLALAMIPMSLLAAPRLFENLAETAFELIFGLASR